MNIEIIQKPDLRFVMVGSELRNEVLERYDWYLTDIDEEDELTREIRRDIEEGTPITLNAYAAQSFVQDIEDQLVSRKGSLFKAIKRFYVDTGIAKEFDDNVDRLVFSSSGVGCKAKPDFTLNGKKYEFDHWLKLEDEQCKV